MEEAGFMTYAASSHQVLPSSSGFFHPSKTPRHPLVLKTPRWIQSPPLIEIWSSIDVKIVFKAALNIKQLLSWIKSMRTNLKLLDWKTLFSNSALTRSRQKWENINRIILVFLRNRCATVPWCKVTQGFPLIPEMHSGPEHAKSAASRGSPHSGNLDIYCLSSIFRGIQRAVENAHFLVFQNRGGGGAAGRTSPERGRLGRSRKSVFTPNQTLPPCRLAARRGSINTGSVHFSPLPAAAWQVVHECGYLGMQREANDLCRAMRNSPRFQSPLALGDEWERFLLNPVKGHFPSKVNLLVFHRISGGTAVIELCVKLNTVFPPPHYLDSSCSSDKLLLPRRGAGSRQLRRQPQYLCRDQVSVSGAFIFTFVVAVTLVCYLGVKLQEEPERPKWTSHSLSLCCGDCGGLMQVIKDVFRGKFRFKRMSTCTILIQVEVNTSQESSPLQ